MCWCSFRINGVIHSGHVFQFDVLFHLQTLYWSRTNPAFLIYKSVCFSLQLPMDDFYSSCIKNLVVSCDDSRHGGHVTVSRLPNFGDVAPYLERIRDKSLSLTVARWLTEELKEEQEKTKALETAISIATQCLEQAQSEVHEHIIGILGRLSVIAGKTFCQTCSQVIMKLELVLNRPVVGKY